MGPSPGLSGEVIVSSVLGQVAQVFQVQAAGFRPFARDDPGIYYYPSACLMARSSTARRWSGDHC